LDFAQKSNFATEPEITRVKNGRVLLLPGNDQTAGHGTTARARFWQQALAELLQNAPRRAK
jgi:homoserine O-acetyltransferase